MPQTVLVVAAHPDDEVLGCGATIARRAKDGDVVHIVLLGEGITSRFSRRENADRADLDALQEEARQVGQMLGAKSVEFAGLPDNRFDTVALLDIVKRLESWVEDLSPDVIYTHHPGDLNNDHAVTFRAVLTAVRPMQNCTVSEVYTFEVLSSTEWAFQQFPPSFKPNVFQEVGATIDLKARCLERYEGEVRSFPHPRSGEAVRVSARRWGSVVGVEYAEAFELVRSVRR